jgi:hypothetical protein
MQTTLSPKPAAQNLNLEGWEFEDVLRILFRIASFIEIFGYENFLQDVTQDGGQWGPASGIGSREAINLVPGGRSHACHHILLALGHGRNKPTRFNQLNWPFRTKGAKTIGALYPDQRSLQFARSCRLHVLADGQH